MKSLGILFLFLFSIKSSGSEPLCSITTGHAYTIHSEQQTHIDRYQHGEKDQYVQYSSHLYTEELKLLNKLWLESKKLKETPTAKAQARIQDKVKQHLSENYKKLRHLQEAMVKIKTLHRAKPFDYVGIEVAPGESFDKVRTYINVAQKLRVNLRAHSGMAPQEIENLLLLLLGDEFYPLLPGNLLSDVPVITTENPIALKKFGEKGQTCRKILNTIKGNAQSFKNSHPNRAKKLENEIDYFFAGIRPVGETSAATYRNLENRLLNEVKTLLSMSSDVEAYLKRELKSCEIFLSPDRDNALGEMMIQDFPKGKTLIYRGTDHRQALFKGYVQACGKATSPETKTSNETQSVLK